MLDAFADRWALVTGASSGIGAEFARRLAARGMHLILTARREDLLRELAEELDTRHGSQTLILSADLADPSSSQWLIEEIKSRGIELELLVNNAGFAIVSDVEHTSIKRVQQLLQVNVASLTQLTYHVLPDMLARRHGAVINVSSVAGFQPVAYMPVYAATKAYVLHFTEAIWAEARDRGVTVMALCPGVTDTAFFRVAGVPNWIGRQTTQSPDRVVRTALKALSKRKQYTIPGWRNYLRSIAVRLTTRRTAVKESMKYFRPDDSDSPDSRSEG